jgi:outer membrane protein insertion porin family
VFNFRAKAGSIWPYSGKTVPVYEEFYVGGLYSVRGFEYGMAGPVSPLTREPLGAEKMVVFNYELIVPLSRAIGLKGALFFDAGKGFNSIKDDAPGRDGGLFPLRTAAGVGIRWFSPFGPIHIDMGWNLSPKEGEKSNVFDFTAGTVF